MVILLKIQQKCNQPFTIKCNWCMRRHDRIGNDFATFATSKGVDEIFGKEKLAGSWITKPQFTGKRV